MQSKRMNFGAIHNPIKNTNLNRGRYFAVRFFVVLWKIIQKNACSKFIGFEKNQKGALQ